MTPISGEASLLASAVMIVGSLGTVYKLLKNAARRATANEAAAVLRSDVGKEVIKQGIQEHAFACTVPANAHRELMEATGRIETAVEGLSNRTENLTRAVFELARNGKGT